MNEYQLAQTNPREGIMRYAAVSRFHARVDVSDWYAAQSLTGALNIRDGVCTLQFSDATGLSSSDLHSLILSLSTDRLI